MRYLALLSMWLALPILAQTIPASQIRPSTTNGQVITTVGGATVWAAPSAGTYQLTGDVLAGPGSGSLATTLATVNASPGSCGDATHVCDVTTNAKGLTTSQSPVAISFPSTTVIQTNSTNNASQTTLNFETSTANTVGLTITPSNPSGGIEKYEITGTYNGSISSGQVTAALGYTPTPYPGAGIPNSTGSAWATSYTTSGSGGVLALTVSPSFTTPSLGVATATTINTASIAAFGSGNAVAAGNLPLSSTGGNNTSVGSGSLINDSSGQGNTGIGETSLNQDSTGSYNTALGYGAGSITTTGSQNTSIGEGSGPTTAALTNTLSLGYGAQPSTSNTGVIGNGSVSDVYFGSTTPATTIHVAGCVGCGGGSSAFSALTSGTNTTAAMLVGTGASLGVTGSGTIAATTAATLASTPSQCSAGGFATGITAAGAANCTSHAPFAPVQVSIASGTLSAGTCSSETAVTIPGLLLPSGTTPGSTFTYAAEGSLAAVTGWGASGGMVFYPYVYAANTMHWYVCNQLDSNLTYGAVKWDVGGNL